MSTQGRSQDALYDLLWGYEDGQGAFTPGLLHDLGFQRVSNLINPIIDMVRPILSPAPVVQPTVCPDCGGGAMPKRVPHPEGRSQICRNDFHRSGVIDTPEGEKPA